MWRTGWAKGAARKALAALDTLEHCGGLVLADDAEPVDDVPAVGGAPPALDATPMAWKQREWYLPGDPSPR